ncbi:MAG TPA: ribosome maturation factor RimM [Actinomycetota bacterium]|nr:ribosome maturation factor RimM [Actinomycetota bacterium]
MDEPTIVVGRVARSHGVRGEVAVHVLSENPERFEVGSAVYLEDGRALTVESARPHGGRLLVLFREIGDRTLAEQLRGRFLVVPETMLPELPEGSWWPHEVQGCQVVTDSGRALGTLTEVLFTPANDVWVAKSSEAETLIPVLEDVLVSVDVRGKRIVVRDLPGLTTPEEP